MISQDWVNGYELSEFSVKCCDFTAPVAMANRSYLRIKQSDLAGEPVEIREPVSWEFVFHRFNAPMRIGPICDFGASSNEAVYRLSRL